MAKMCVICGNRIENEDGVFCNASGIDISKSRTVPCNNFIGIKCKNCFHYIENKDSCKLNSKYKIPAELKSCWMFSVKGENKIKKQKIGNTIQKRLEAI